MTEGTGGVGSSAALEALEFSAVLDVVASFAVGRLGAEAIKARTPSDDPAWIGGELATVAELSALTRESRGVVPEPVPPIREALARLRISGSVLEAAELLAIRRVVTASRLVVAELRRVAAEAPRTALLEQPLPARNLERRLELSLDDDGQLLDSASPALASARSDVRTARERLVHRLEQILRGLGGDGGVTVRNGRYVIPVAAELRGRPDGIVHGESASGASLFLEPSAAIPLGNALREAESREEREALKVFRELTDLARPERDTIAAAHAMCVQVDDLAARARYGAAVKGEVPRVASAPTALVIRNGRHPLLLAAEAPERPTTVPFDLELAEQEFTVLISGPNTGGKSVLLKAVGLCCALAQSGIIPPVGTGTTLPVFRQFFADIGDRQSIAASLSTFSAHAAALRHILEDADDRTLILLDEIGSGTDPAEGAALAGAVLLSLTRRGAITMATTHLGALKQLASKSPGVVNASLQFDAATLRPSYRFLKGVPGRSYGLAIARRLGLPEEVLVEAEAQVPDAERSLDALLAAIETREREQARREAELADQLAETAALRARLDAANTTQEARELELQRRERDAQRTAKEQTRSFLLQARALVEEAIAKARDAGDESRAREARRMVEEAIQAESREPEAPISPLHAPAGYEVGSLAVGDRVALDTGAPGEVLELRSDGKAVVRVGAVKLVVARSTLRPGGADPTRNPPHRGGPSPVAATLSLTEIDLRGMTGDEAEITVLSAIDAAVLAENPILRIIHGKGTGVVRDRVQRVISRDRRVRSHSFAPANQGGTGVTVVELEG